MKWLEYLHPSRLPLRARLTLWYLLTLTAILLLFLTFLYWQVQRSLVAQVDAALQLAAAQALARVDEAGDRLAFQNRENTPAIDRRLSDDFAIYLVGPEGTHWDWLGRRQEFPAQLPQSGAITVRYAGDPWRLYSEPIITEDGRLAGWLQVAQEMDPVAETLASLRAQMLLGLPLALLLAGLGGFFLAWRALRPIDRIAQTAASINAGNLSRRIGYTGPADEVGRLAATFDNMLERLEAGFERQRRFTGDAAHELRTPLTALKGRLEVTLSRPRPAGDYTATLAEMEEQVDRLIRLSNDLLFMARLDRGQRSLQQEQIELEGLSGALIEHISPLADAKDVAIHQAMPAGLNVRGDRDLLIRLFLNLMDNAVKYTPPGGEVTVTGQSLDRDVLVSIQDTGPGIPAEHLPHLFERFYRVEGDRARRFDNNGQGGAGLGLAIAYEIARVHGGVLTVQSVMGVGTTFTVRLPQVRPQ